MVTPWDLAQMGKAVRVEYEAKSMIKYKSPALEDTNMNEVKKVLAREAFSLR